VTTASRDFYELLGVERGASDADLKKAFRKRARELHPDVNKDPEAEARFKEAARAYEVLANPETRALYDRYGEQGLRAQPGAGADWGGFASFQDIFDAFFGGDPFGRGTPRRREGDDVGVAVEITFGESATGVHRDLELDVLAPCGTCEATGAAPGAEVERCGLCGGQGRVRQVSRGPLGQVLREQICPQCAGAGQMPSEPCATCSGRGVVPERRTVAVDIPAGIDHGQQIRITGAGHAGDLGAPAGDLYVQVSVRPDPRFRREGLDVLTRIAVPVTDAMVGATVRVPTLDGETDLELRAGTQAGDELVLRGKGFPALRGRARGDQRVAVDVRIPRVATDGGRAAVERLAEELDVRSYREDEGFFDRLKHAFR
jgi:molecular chaperone DnaJ